MEQTEQRTVNGFRDAQDLLRVGIGHFKAKLILKCKHQLRLVKAVVAPAQRTKKEGGKKGERSSKARTNARKTPVDGTD